MQREKSEFQFTRPIRAAIPPACLYTAEFYISIHATHTGRDVIALRLCVRLIHFNSRDPYGPRFHRPPLCKTHKFQFTRPIRAAICGRFLAYRSRAFQFTRPIRAAINDRFDEIEAEANFNSRDPYGPRWEGRVMDVVIREFQFTRPIRAAINPQSISYSGSGFQFTRPIRAAMINAPREVQTRRFQFTRPIRAAIFVRDDPRDERAISIHATHTGRDLRKERDDLQRDDFNSRDPYGPRSCTVDEIELGSEISIHATHTGRDTATHMRRIAHVCTPVPLESRTPSSA